MNRKDFFKKACLSGICMCGFSSIAFSADNKNSGLQSELRDNNETIVRAWLSTLLANISNELDEQEKRKILKSCSVVHYENLNMEEILAPYIGNLEKFIDFLQEKWGWKVDYNEKTKTLIADENKNNCVCPVLSSKDGTDKSAMCYCSEGFAERMFSVVNGSKALATVVSSIHRGDKTCIYKIVFD